MLLLVQVQYFLLNYYSLFLLFLLLKTYFLEGESKFPLSLGHDSQLSKTQPVGADPTQRFRPSSLANCPLCRLSKTANSSVVQYCLITTEYKQILTSIIFCLSEVLIVVFSLAGRRGIEPLGMRFGVSPQPS